MPSTCCVYGCKNRFVKDGGKHFYRFPKDKVKFRAWVNSINRDNWQPSINSKICSAHFKKEDFKLWTNRKDLKPNAVPSVFPPVPRHLQKQGKKIGEIRETEREVQNEFSFSLNESNERGEEIDKDISNKQLKPFSIHNDVEPKIFEPESIEIAFYDDSIDEDNPVEADICDESSSDTYIPQVALSFTEKVELIQETTPKDKNINPDIVRELESKCNKLNEENRVLKINVDSLTRAVDALKTEIVELEKIKKFGGILPGEPVVDLRYRDTTCRVCLQQKQNLKSISEKIHFGNPNIPTTSILNILKSIEIDTFVDGPNIPDQICSQCLDCLKYCFTFTQTYKKSTAILKYYSEKLNNLKSNGSKEHIGNERIFLRNDIELINETEQIHSYENGYEKSAFYVRKNKSLPQNESLPLVCPVCEEELSVKEYREHISTHNILKKDFIETDLTKKTNFFALPRNDVCFMRDTGKLHSCPFCQEKFRATSFLRHIKHHLKNNYFPCQKCKKVFRNRLHLTKHIASHKRPRLKCYLCLQYFPDKYKLNNHRCQTSGVFICRYCKKAFFSPRSLTEHNSTLHAIDRKRRRYRSEYNIRYANGSSHTAGFNYC